MNEKEQIEKLIAGDEKAFRDLIDENKQRIFKVCIGFLHGKEDAEDITQEVFIEVFRSIKKFGGNSSLSTWVYRIAVNKSLNVLQKRKSNGFLTTIQNALGLKQAVAVSNPHKELISKERNSFLNKAIDALPENQRIAFTLAKYDDLSYNEIAGIMNTSVSSVESLMHRAKTNLQKSLAAYVHDKT